MKKNKKLQKSPMNSDIHFKLLDILEKNPELSQRLLSRELGISLGSINYCIRALIEKGQVKAQNFKNNSNKIGYVYLLTPQGISEKIKMTKDFLKKRINEYEELQSEIERLKHDMNKANKLNLTDKNVK
jgi:EPS-associated MarR family transcriptional regulator